MKLTTDDTRKLQVQGEQTMGMYDTYYDDKLAVQLKCGECMCTGYAVGSVCDLSDGLYIGHEGVVGVRDGRVVLVTDHIVDKWGGILDLSEIIESRNPIS